LWSTHRDPLKTLSGWLTEQHLADAGIFEQIETEAHNEMKAAVDFAVKAPFPDASEVTDHVYA
jgi:TPP-dependent pyruvate/acetoin dehydrogenase alpha subunit